MQAIDETSLQPPPETPEQTTASQEKAAVRPRQEVMAQEEDNTAEEATTGQRAAVDEEEKATEGEKTVAGETDEAQEETVPEVAAPAPDVPSGPVVINLKDFSLNPDKITVKAGNIMFVFKNEGRYTHDFRVEGQGVDEKAPRVGAGRERQWEITLEPGEYRISCPISNHDERACAAPPTRARRR